MTPITITDEKVLRALVAYARGEITYYVGQYQSGLNAPEWHPLCEAAGLDTIQGVFDEDDITWLEKERRRDKERELADG